MSATDQEVECWAAPEKYLDSTTNLPWPPQVAKQTLSSQDPSSNANTQTQYTTSASDQDKSARDSTVPDWPKETRARPRLDYLTRPDGSLRTESKAESKAREEARLEITADGLKMFKQGQIKYGNDGAGDSREGPSTDAETRASKVHLDSLLAQIWEEEKASTRGSPTFGRRLLDRRIVDKGKVADRRSRRLRDHFFKHRARVHAVALDVKELSKGSVYGTVLANDSEAKEAYDEGMQYYSTRLSKAELDKWQDKFLYMVRLASDAQKSDPVTDAQRGSARATVERTSLYSRSAQG